METFKSHEKDLSYFFKTFPEAKAIEEEIKASLENTANTNAKNPNTVYEAITRINPLIEHKVKTNSKLIGLLDVLGNYSLYVLFGLTAFILAVSEFVKAIKN